jgi:3-methylcrotonyl-CoA carboxylase alpha subunit
MFRKVLIANRGEIAVRVARTCRRLGIATVAVHSDADAASMHVAACDEAVRIGPPQAAESYLKADAILAAARATGADAIHPGYGFLSENAAFAEAVAAAGLTWIGPPPDAIRAMGLKDAAKARMEAAGVPVVPGFHGEAQDPAYLAGVAGEIGFPVLIKARAGGGGKGMRRVDGPERFAEALEGARREAEASFGDPAVLIEKYVASPRHIEMQVFADSQGNCVHLFERDCSLQRRHQKVIEEAPAPGMPPEMRAAMGAAAVRAAQAVGYVGAGTVEFIADASEGLRADRFWFLEMNTRLQVEHPVTELIVNEDLVEWQLRIAAGEPLPKTQSHIFLDGWAVEARLYAEDPGEDFRPATGRIAHLDLPSTLRVDAGVRAGDAVTPFYDPMIAKLIAHGPTRDAAFARLAAALDRTEIAGVIANAGFLARLLRHPDVAAGRVDTGLIDREAAALLADPAPDPAAWLLAALAALDLIEEGGADPWAAREGWRAWGPALAVATLAQGAAPAEIRLSRDGAAWRAETPAGPVAASVSPKPDGSLRLVLDGHARRGRALRHGDSITVFLDGLTHRFAAPDPLAAGEDVAASDDAALAPLPGVVRAVHVAPGDAVKAGDRLVTLEAMKMEHALRAARDGVVAEVAVAEGETVAEGALLAALAPA